MIYLNFIQVYMGFPGGLDGKESACSARDLGSIPGLGRSPGGGHGNPLQFSCLENPRGQKSPVGYSPLGRKESDATERLSTAQQCRVLVAARAFSSCCKRGLPFAAVPGRLTAVASLVAECRL